MPYCGRNLGSTDAAHGAERARVGAEERVGAEQWSEGGDSSFWNSVLVYGGEEGEFVVSLVGIRSTDLQLMRECCASNGVDVV